MNETFSGHAPGIAPVPFCWCRTCKPPLDDWNDRDARIAQVEKRKRMAKPIGKTTEIKPLPTGQKATVVQKAPK